MPTTTRTLEELASRGNDIFEQQVRGALAQEDNGKFVAIDVESGAYEVDPDDFAAISRLRARKPLANIWLMRAGSPTTYRMGAGR